MAKKPSTAVIAGKGKSRAASPTTTRVSVTDKRGAERTVEVRKIENGYVVRESVYSPRKGYTSKERFSEKCPTLAIEAPKK